LLTDTPSRVDGAWAGELWALMLDTKSTFDAAVLRYARDEAQARAIQESRHFRNLCDTLSGTQEYMAVEKLYQLDQEGGFDLIVVDTPPTRRAVDFLNAPRHLTRLLDNPAFRMLVMPSRVSMRAAAVAAQGSLKVAAKIVGAEMVFDTLAFLRAFEGMEAGIHGRAQRVLELFAEPSTAFVLVVAPRRDAIDEGQCFAAHLSQSDIPVQALIVNCLHPHFDVQPVVTPPSVPGQESDPARSGMNAQAFTVLSSNWAELRAEAEHEANLVTVLAALVAPAPVVRVPLLARDVHDVVGVQTVADHLMECLAEDGGEHRVETADAVPPNVDVDGLPGSARRRATADRFLQRERVKAG
jgi:anion-transporting  ArsA/GET3 family ATPase